MNTSRALYQSELFRPVSVLDWLRIFGFWVLIGLFGMSAEAWANHRGSTGHESVEETHLDRAIGHPVAGTDFQIYVGPGKGDDQHLTRDDEHIDQAIQSVMMAFEDLVVHRKDHKRFDEALTKGALNKVIIEPRVFNRDGKEFAFLVARTKQKGRVNLLINAAMLEEKGYIDSPDKLVPVISKEFQWVISKADTTKKKKSGKGERDLGNAPILSNKVIREMTGDERVSGLQALFQNYLTTVDAFGSLKGQPYFDVGRAGRKTPEHEDTTGKLYDIRVREALQTIVREPYFVEHTPKAVRSLLNGKIWNVTYADIPSRDWATRTRVLPEEKAVKVGAKGRLVQPAKVLVNIYQLAAEEDPFYNETHNLPMGALSKEQLAKVIAMEIEHNIIEKSMRGHTAADEQSAP